MILSIEIGSGAVAMNHTLSKVATKSEIKPWIRRFGRFGHMAKGAVYGFIGVFALMAALRVGGETTGTSGALQSVAGIPFGEFLLWLIGVGLIGYVLWEAIKMIKDPENKGHDTKGIVTRIGYIISAIIYANIAIAAIKLALHAGNVKSKGSEQGFSAKLLSEPFGQWLVGLLGTIILVYGLYELYKGSKEKFMKKFNLGEMNAKEKRILRSAGKMGLISRGIVLGMIGYFFIQTAITANPNQTKGLEGALDKLAQQPFGQGLLGIAGVGLFLFGVYEVIRGRYGSMNFGN
jgi:hypothetical protein